MALDEQLTSVLESSPEVQLAVLFGSAARREAGPGSDVDIGVLLSEGADIGSLEVALGRATGRAIDLVRLDTAPPLLRFEIARHGRLLVERAANTWVDFKAKAMVDWWDWAPTAGRMHRLAIDRLRAQVTRGSS